MDIFLKELYFENLDIIESKSKEKKEDKNSEISDLEEQLLLSFDKKQKDLFEKYIRLSYQEDCEAEFEKFTQGFKFGVKLTVEGLS